MRGGSKLSPREQEILTILAEGLMNKEIANRLEITEATVKVHLKNSLRILGLHNRVQAAVWEAQRQWLVGEASIDFHRREVI